MSARPFWIYTASRGSLTSRPPKSAPVCSMKAFIAIPFAPCIAFCTRMTKCAKGDGNCAIPLIDDALRKHDIAPDQLTLHADRGGPMKAKATVLPLADLGVTKSHSRP